MGFKGKKNLATWECTNISKNWSNKYFSKGQSWKKIDIGLASLWETNWGVVVQGQVRWHTDDKWMKQGDCKKHGLSLLGLPSIEIGYREMFLH